MLIYITFFRTGIRGINKRVSTDVQDILMQNLYGKMLSKTFSGSYLLYK